MEKVVVTGGLGFIFSHVSEYLASEGLEVHVIDNQTAGSHPELIPQFLDMGMYVYNQHVSNAEVKELITELNPEYIVHAAAFSDVDFSIREPDAVISANNQATLNVFEAARRCTKLKKLLYVSTDEVYGECDHPKTEDELLFPKNPYALSKAFGSILRLTYDNTYPELKDKTCETRFCNVYGERQDDRKIIPAIKRAIDGGEPVKLHNDGAGYRQWINVKDIPPVIKLLLEKGDRTYNITTGFGCTVKELLDFAAKVTAKDVPTVVGERSGMDMKYQMSGERMKEDFGWEPMYQFEEELKKLLHAKAL